VLGGFPPGLLGVNDGGLDWMLSQATLSPSLRQYMNILFIGDIFAAAGRTIVAENFRNIVKEHQIDLAIANSENSAGGFGVTPAIADELFALGIDVQTGGNHSFDKREIVDYMPHHPRLLRPANYPSGVAGSGVFKGTTRDGIGYAVINLQGRAQMANIDCPFRKADEILDAIDPAIRIRFVDFHAELTSEKVAMGWHLDGRATAMVGTHTHVPTADTRVLPGGLGYQTDAGMTGPYDSVIGVEKETIVKRFLTGVPGRMEAAKNGLELHGVIVNADEITGKARSIERITCYQ
jgi:metallophosphoesterase (TIGR00282 family)